MFDITCFSTCLVKDAEQKTFHIKCEKPCMSTNISEAQRHSTCHIIVSTGTSRIIIKCTCTLCSECKYSHDLQKVIAHAAFAPLQHNYSLHAHDGSTIRQTTACLTQ